ncbi:MAG: hypothetical protein ACOC1P_03130 [Minisyncoccales bacterium]
MILEEVKRKLGVKNKVSFDDNFQKTKLKEDKKMQTKSRYEVISELEQQKRNLIKERDSLNEELLEKDKKVKELERQKADTIVYVDRQIEDAQAERDNFEKTMAERKETIKELIKSVDDSLTRFNNISQKE